MSDSGKKRKPEKESFKIKKGLTEDETPQVETEDLFEDEFAEDDEWEDVEEDGMEVEGDDEDEKDAPVVPKKTFRPGVDKLAEDEVLEVDPTAYEMLHSLTMEYPCLSFDILPDKLGMQRTKYPLTAYAVTGTQADTVASNKLFIMKLSSLHRTKHDHDPDASDDDDPDDLDDDPELEYKSVPHPGAVNRIRAMPQEPSIVATWSEDGAVYVWNLEPFVKALDTPPSAKLPVVNAAAKLTAHKTEGFALAWSPHKPGRLITADCASNIHLTEPADGGTWKQNTQAYSSHKDSVEDLVWSPGEPEVFASCSVDGTIKLWDTRKKSAARSFKASSGCDVNVMSWNSKVSYLLASGAEDGSFNIWDLRSIKSDKTPCTSVGHFKWHTDQITSIEWDPNDESAIAVSGADDQITIWDLSVERDTEAAGADAEEDDFPPQLMFVHQGQTNMKELHYHPQLPGVLLSTAEDGFNIFKPSITVSEEVRDDS